MHGVKTSKEQEYLTGWKRSRAEFDNFKKRTFDAQHEQKHRLKRDLAEPLLDLADNFKAITSHLPPALSKDAWAQGVMHVVKKLDEVLQAYEIALIDKTGEPFDPARHEAVTQVEGGAGEAGHVVEVITPGYSLGRHVLRPAKVKVSA